VKPMPEKGADALTLSVRGVVERYLDACVERYGISQEMAEALLDKAVQLRGPVDRKSDFPVCSEFEAWLYIDFAMEQAEHPLVPALFLIQRLRDRYERCVVSADVRMDRRHDFQRCKG